MLVIDKKFFQVWWSLEKKEKCKSQLKSEFEESVSLLISKKIIANAPVPVTNIKMPVDLRLQLRRHTDTLMLT